MSRSAGPSGLRVVVNTEGLRVPVAAARLRDAVRAVLGAGKVRHALVSLTLLTPRRMAALHRRHLARTGATDVIAFGFRDPAGAVIGDVYLCPSVASANARQFGNTVREELVRLAIHGTLHVLGHDHPPGDGRTRSPMWRTQERLVRRVLAS
ncbi:MAG: rRNA maturation RNase YbeY [Gemmatimonadaceae bacterium]